MRLIRARTLEFAEFFEDRISPYAILSHTWGDEEISFKQACERTPAIESRSGWAKIRQTCGQAIRDGLDYAWIDTCCIDKTNGAELSESINFMCKWYEKSSSCYSFLVDVPYRDDWHHGMPHESFAASRWFTRGWTLQYRYLSALHSHLGHVALHWESNIRQLGYLLLAGNVAVLVVVRYRPTSSGSLASTYPASSKLDNPVVLGCFRLFWGGLSYLFEHFVRFRPYPRFFQHTGTVVLILFHTLVCWRVALALGFDPSEVSADDLLIVLLCMFSVGLLQRFSPIHL